MDVGVVFARMKDHQRRHHNHHHRLNHVDERGAFFGKAGSFEAGYAFDAVVLDDSVMPCPRRLPVGDRLERAFYLELDRTGITMKFIAGRRIL